MFFFEKKNQKTFTILEAHRTKVRSLEGGNRAIAALGAHLLTKRRSSREIREPAGAQAPDRRASDRRWRNRWLTPRKQSW